MSIIIADNSPSWIKMELDCVFKNCGAVLVRNYSNIILALSTELIMKIGHSSDKGLTLKTAALKLFTVANLHYQLS